MLETLKPTEVFLQQQEIFVAKKDNDFFHRFYVVRKMAVGE